MDRAMRAMKVYAAQRTRPRDQRKIGLSEAGIRYQRGMREEVDGSQRLYMATDEPECCIQASAAPHIS